MKRGLTGFIALMLTIMILVAGCNSGNNSGSAVNSNSGQNKEPVEIEFMATQPEWAQQEQEIWTQYQAENPHVKIKVVSFNEDQMSTLRARIAAGNAPHLGFSVSTSWNFSSEYKNFTNLLDIDWPHFDLMNFDVKAESSKASSIDNYLPVLPTLTGLYWSFVYYEDLMKETGLDPKQISTWDDLDKFLADFKAWNDQNKAYDYIIDTAWHSWVYGLNMPNLIGTSLGGSEETYTDMYTGKKKWTDNLDENPAALFFEKWKEYYDKGYLPDKWWTRAWEADMESTLISKKSMLTIHGPWIWDKILAANPSAKLAGFPIPAHNGIVATTPVDFLNGDVIFAGHEDKPIFEEVKKAFYWWTSPEILLQRADISSQVPTLEFEGELSVNTPQFKGFVIPLLDGEYGDIEFSTENWADLAASKYKIAGKPDVINDDANATIVGKYMEGSVSIEQLMEHFQTRWADGYKIE